MPFDRNFASGEEKRLVAAVRASRGCFNPSCGAPAASRACSKCHVAVYCSRDCQRADWKLGGEMSHKTLCQIYYNNITPGVNSPKGQEFPMPVALRSVGFIEEQQMFDALERRGEAFLKEAKRVVGDNDMTIGLVANCMYNFNLPILQCSATVFDADAGDDAPGSFNGKKHERVEYVVFVPIGKGGDHVREKLHPPLGSGDISKQHRRNVVKELKAFVAKAVNDYGLSVDVFTYQRGLMWMSNDGFQSGGAKELEKANGGKRIRWSPDMQYAHEDAMTHATEAAFGGLRL